MFTKLGINNIENSLSGYNIFVEFVTIFEFDKSEKLTKKEASDLIYISGLSIAISNMRNYISNMTSNFPFGKYQLPAIDINALHKEKNKILNSKSNNKKKKVTTAKPKKKIIKT